MGRYEVSQFGVCDSFGGALLSRGGDCRRTRGREHERHQTCQDKALGSNGNEGSKKLQVYLTASDLALGHWGIGAFGSVEGVKGNCLLGS